MAFIGRAGRVADAVKRSPQLLRKKFDERFGRHQTLDEDWLHENEALVDGISFYVKYLGCGPASEAQGHGVTDEAVNRLVAEAKWKKSKGDAKLEKVVLTITPKHIKIQDLSKESEAEVMPIFRISYCTADPNHPRIFAFNAREKQSLQIRCRAFLCAKPKMAKAIALTLAQAFNVAYETWEAVKEDKKQTDRPSPLASNGALKSETDRYMSNGSSIQMRTSSEPLNGNFLHPHDDYSGRNSSSVDAPSVQLTPPSTRKKTSLRKLDFTFDDEFDQEFTKLANSRSNPHLLDIGFAKEEIQRENWEPILDISQSEDHLFKSKSFEDLSKTDQ
ncbi:low density lipoprotein receptor adapter protein 1-A-like [Xenia sp. Carnegie-2017]|uniref:low density lipoprotein receptor adapter protein 1-A-like n=1 Tax=Xenia sp. Carnegie-2017 TaxID=2897299 RepID=UPI001F043A83|nr:low density lipoprotein receptor adapter protein 1-A-like [Xenia sp. Carnegie-2017]XP_046847288.1 low density lipoprotein receptor adapter protein 1-A-like [Xenia sp. Carnegie-2017]